MSRFLDQPDNESQPQITGEDMTSYPGGCELTSARGTSVRPDHVDRSHMRSMPTTPASADPADTG
jgi:hypothetical protein